MTAAVALSALTHKTVQLGHSLTDLPSPSINVVHVQRPHAAVIEQPDRRLLHAKSGGGVRVREQPTRLAGLVDAMLLPLRHSADCLLAFCHAGCH